jgi:hypothetical protein
MKKRPYKPCIICGKKKIRAFRGGPLDGIYPTKGGICAKCCDLPDFEARMKIIEADEKQNVNKL